MENGDLKNWLNERKITEVECLVPDMTGNARGKIIPADKFIDEGGMRLPETIFLQTVTGEWPDDMDDVVHEADRDMVASPDLSAARMVPWVKDPTAQIIHDCFEPNGKAHELSPRNILKRVIKLYEDEGLQPVVAPEVEFFLVKKNTNPDFPLEPPVGRSGRPETARQSYSIDAVNEFDPLFEDMYDYCDAMGLDVDTLIHESGAAQMEVNFLHGDPLSLADQVFLYKRTMREVAARHDVYVTFMAKPMDGEPGSSMHIHQSLIDQASGKNIFSQDDGSHTDAFMSYIAGLQKYVPASMVFFAPNVNSYRRIMRDESAPINVQWGMDNRTVGLRVPHSTAAATRIENRFAGADSNPYLAIALSLACGYLGMKEKLKPTEMLEGSAYDLPFELPRSLEQALIKLNECEPLKDILGHRFVQAYSSVKTKEYETFFRVISSWEREFLLLNV
ncbi:glutamine synthetase family protein [Oceanicoccus sagamiensis]|uniref:Glutamine synthetase n=1 Tax=Oceanicoccus sagamiensis TaxID=716816 RepID=A0A1X9ND69_9GAMM|nr:glutamine synthetase family protein [Oceanicoccus sagamiensis]ARN73479.1 glutamine synthetase [Oceanicoccus sagamiensis]